MSVLVANHWTAFPKPHSITTRQKVKLANQITHNHVPVTYGGHNRQTLYTGYLDTDQKATVALMESKSAVI